MQELYMGREVMPSLRSRAALVQSVVHNGQSAADDLLQHHMRHLMRSRSSSSSSSRRSSSSSFGRSRSRGFGRSSFGGGTTGGSIGSVIAIIIALIVIAVLVYFAYKFYQKRKRSKEEAAFDEESPSHAGHNQAPYVATGVPVSGVPPMGVDPGKQANVYNPYDIADPSTASQADDGVHNPSQAAPEPPQPSPYMLYHPGDQQQAPTPYGQHTVQSGAPGSAAYPYGNAGYPGTAGPPQHAPAV